MREIVLDTETTGMEPEEGHRIIEIGCVELDNAIPTGRHWHAYINPERDVPQEAVSVHGLDYDFLRDKPTFGEIVGDYLDFTDNAHLVIHNAEFDVKFLNAELRPFGFGRVDNSRVIDTLAIAREKFPGSPANLDALCRRFDIDNESRDLHGALLDAELLAKVYLELIGGRQHGLSLVDDTAANGNQVQFTMPKRERQYRPPRAFPVPEEEQQAHARLLEKLDDPVWKRLGKEWDGSARRFM
jgi:DNA polymerase-3 subunit epsilon